MKDDVESIRSKNLDALRAEIQKGLDSGEPTPLNIEEVNARGRKRRDRNSFAKQ